MRNKGLNLIFLLSHFDDVRKNLKPYVKFIQKNIFCFINTCNS